jgi:hypothetical protein
MTLECETSSCLQILILDILGSFEAFLGNFVKKEHNRSWMSCTFFELDRWYLHLMQPDRVLKNFNNVTVCSLKKLCLQWCLKFTITHISIIFSQDVTRVRLVVNHERFRLPPFHICMVTSSENLFFSFQTKKRKEIPMLVNLTWIWACWSSFVQESPWYRLGFIGGLLFVNVKLFTIHLLCGGKYELLFFGQVFSCWMLCIWDIWWLFGG